MAGSGILNWDLLRAQLPMDSRRFWRYSYYSSEPEYVGDENPVELDMLMGFAVFFSDN